MGAPRPSNREIEELEAQKEAEGAMRAARRGFSRSGIFIPEGQGQPPESGKPIDFGAEEQLVHSNRSVTAAEMYEHF